MFVRLIESQIAKYWDIIKSALVASELPTVTFDEEGLLIALKSLMDGTMQCWVTYEEAGNMQISILGVTVTRIVFDEVTGTTSLSVEAVMSLQESKTSREYWMEGLRALLAFARDIGCTRLVAYTDSHSVTEFLRDMGANIMTYAAFKLK